MGSPAFVAPAATVSASAFVARRAAPGGRPSAVSVARVSRRSALRMADEEEKVRCLSFGQRLLRLGGGRWHLGGASGEGREGGGWVRSGEAGSWVTTVALAGWVWVGPCCLFACWCLWRGVVKCGASYISKGAAKKRMGGWVCFGGGIDVACPALPSQGSLTRHCVNLSSFGERVTSILFLCGVVAGLTWTASFLVPSFPIAIPLFGVSSFFSAQVPLVSGADILKTLREDASNDIAPPPRSGTTRDGDGKANIWVCHLESERGVLEGRGGEGMPEGLACFGCGGWALHPGFCGSLLLPLAGVRVTQKRRGRVVRCSPGAACALVALACGVCSDRQWGCVIGKGHCASPPRAAGGR